MWAESLRLPRGYLWYNISLFPSSPVKPTVDTKPPAAHTHHILKLSKQQVFVLAICRCTLSMSQRGPVSQSLLNTHHFLLLSIHNPWIPQPCSQSPLWPPVCPFPIIPQEGDAQPLWQGASCSSDDVLVGWGFSPGWTKENRQNWIRKQATVSKNRQCPPRSRQGGLLERIFFQEVVLFLFISFSESQNWLPPCWVLILEAYLRKVILRDNQRDHVKEKENHPK